jgi:hypothetical protein
MPDLNEGSTPAPEGWQERLAEFVEAFAREAPDASTVAVARTVEGGALLGTYLDIADLRAALAAAPPGGREPLTCTRCGRHGTDEHDCADAIERGEPDPPPAAAPGRRGREAAKGAWWCDKHDVPMTVNPHPQAGVPALVLEVGAVHECVPCLSGSRHRWAQRAHRAEGVLARLLALRDGPRDENYEREKPLAWEAAREALTTPPPPAAPPGEPLDREAAEALVAELLDDETSEGLQTFVLAKRIVAALAPLLPAPRAAAPDIGVLEVALERMFATVGNARCHHVLTGDGRRARECPQCIASLVAATIRQAPAAALPVPQEGERA